MGEVRFMISEAAKQVQVESHVLRYWEEELGLTIGRTEMGHRYYTKDDIQLFRCIKKLKNEGMRLKDLKPLIPELKATRLKLKESEESSSSSGKSAPAAAKKTDSSESSASKAAQLKPSSVTSLTPKSTGSSEAEVIPVTQLEQVRSLIGDVLTEVVTNNNETLKKDISRTVTTDVMREMDLLFQSKERQEEEHFRKLDCLIRQQQANHREMVKGSPILKLKKMFT